MLRFGLLIGHFSASCHVSVHCENVETCTIPVFACYCTSDRNKTMSLECFFYVVPVAGMCAVVFSIAILVFSVVILVRCDQTISLLEENQSTANLTGVVHSNRHHHQKYFVSIQAKIETICQLVGVSIDSSQKYYVAEYLACLSLAAHGKSEVAPDFLVWQTDVIKTTSPDVIDAISPLTSISPDQPQIETISVFSILNSHLKSLYQFEIVFHPCSSPVSYHNLFWSLKPCQ